MFLFPGAQEHISLGICVSRVGEHISLGIGGFSSMRGKRPRYGCVCDSSYRLLPRTAEKILWHFKFFSIRVHSLPLQNEVQLLICRFSRAKSEALFNTYSLLKHNIKSCNVKRRRQRERQKKTAIDLICKISILHVQHTFLYISLPLHCFARLQHETGSRNFPLTGFVLEMPYAFLFAFLTLSLILAFLAASISHFLTPGIKFLCFSSNDWMTSFVSYLSL